MKISGRDSSKRKNVRCEQAKPTMDCAEAASYSSPQGLNSMNGRLPRTHTAIAYWVTPAEPAHGFFENMICDLARRYDAPVFEPHVTIHVASNHLEAAEKAILQAAFGCEPVELELLDVRHSGEFTKTLFVQLAPNTKLKRLNQIIRHAAQNSSDYHLEPHLSLLYKKISVLARRDLARSIKLPFSEIVFDSIKAVRCASPTRNRVDVEAWHVVAWKSLRW
jgi:2'-5' RNA ligase